MKMENGREIYVVAFWIKMMKSYRSYTNSRLYLQSMVPISSSDGKRRLR